MGLGIAAPVALAADHDFGSFACGVESLDKWLRERATANQKSGASRTYVACIEARVAGYYALASGGLATADASGRFRRNMPDPVPVGILGRLAVDSSLRGQGLGRALFRDAALRLLAAADMIGIRGMIVHAISGEAVAFYQSVGLTASATEPRTLMITLDEIRATL